MRRTSGWVLTGRRAAPAKWTAHGSALALAPDQVGRSKSMAMDLGLCTFVVVDPVSGRRVGPAEQLKAPRRGNRACRRGPPRRVRPRRAPPAGLRGHHPRDRAGGRGRFVERGHGAQLGRSVAGFPTLRDPRRSQRRPRRNYGEPGPLPATLMSSKNACEVPLRSKRTAPSSTGTSSKGHILNGAFVN